MAEPTTNPSRNINPLLRYLPLIAILILMWPLGGQDVEVFGLDMSATVVGAALAILGAVFGMLAARGR